MKGSKKILGLPPKVWYLILLVITCGMIAYKWTDVYDFRSKDEKGFTLIEVLVVLLLIGILVAIALPTFLDGSK